VDQGYFVIAQNAPKGNNKNNGPLVSCFWKEHGISRFMLGKKAPIMNLKETTVESHLGYEGNIIRVLEDKALLPSGAVATREVVLHPGGVAVLALDAQEQVYLVRQYRYPVGRELVELPAGKLDPGEEPSLAAARELREETGLEAEELVYLGHILASPGFCNERLHMYFARGLVCRERHPDEDEFLDVVTLPFDDLIRQIMAGEMEDAKTVATALKVKTLLNR